MPPSQEWQVKFGINGAPIRYLETLLRNWNFRQKMSMKEKSKPRSSKTMPFERCSQCAGPWLSTGGVNGRNRFETKSIKQCLTQILEYSKKTGQDGHISIPSAREKQLGTHDNRFCLHWRERPGEIWPPVSFYRQWAAYM